VPDREGDGKGELIALITTITEMTAAPAPLLAQAYHQRWEHETGNDQLKTHLRGPGRILRSKSPDMVRQEIYGCLLTHHAISALICRAATEADIDPDRVKFTRTVRIVRRAIGPAAFPPEQREHVLAAVRPTSPASRTSTRNGATGPTPGSSNEPATTPTASKDPATGVSATASRRRLSSPTSATQHDQFTVSGIGSSARKSIPDPVTNRLFALSGNQCAFPGCTNAVTDQVAPGEQPVTLAQRAHIVGVGRQGPRSKAALSSDDIDAVENLLLLCGEHHRIVDNNPRIYSVEVLAKYKADHEAKMAPRKLRPVPPPLNTDAVDLSLLSVSDLPGALWRAESQFRAAAEVGEHLPRSKASRFFPSYSSRARYGRFTTSLMPRARSSRWLTRNPLSSSTPPEC
jgi:hypothetical protein